MSRNYFEVCSNVEGEGATAGSHRPARFLSAAPRMAKLAVVGTIVAAFVEVVLNPAAAFSALHFWLALFVAAAYARTDTR